MDEYQKSAQEAIEVYHATRNRSEFAKEMNTNHQVDVSVANVMWELIGIGYER